MKQGKLNVTTVQKSEREIKLTLTNVNYISDLWCNLFSVVAAMKQGCTLIGEGSSLKIRKKDLFCIEFDEIKNENGSSEKNNLLGVSLYRNIKKTR
jgi:hypothetical protein